MISKGLRDNFVMYQSLIWFAEHEKAVQEATLTTTAREEECEQFTADESETTATEDGSEDVFEEEHQVKLFRQKKARYIQG